MFSHEILHFYQHSLRYILAPLRVIAQASTKAQVTIFVT